MGTLGIFTPDLATSWIYFFDLGRVDGREDIECGLDACFEDEDNGMEASCSAGYGGAGAIETVACVGTVDTINARSE